MINTQRLKEEFCRLVSIDSESFQERNMADILTGYLIELGFSVQEDHAGDRYNGNSGNIYAYFPGKLEGEPILFSSHMDTVQPGNGKRAVLHEDGTITSEGNTVLGADDLSGVVSILEAVRVIRENEIPHRNLEILFTIAEEVHLRGSEVFDYGKIRAKEAYVLDLSGPVGTAALKAPSLITFTVCVKGKTSHAGFAPEEGIHAISIAAGAVTKIKQGRIDEETTVNIGTIEGGIATNIIPDICMLKGEVRSFSHEKALAQIRSIEEVFKKEAGLNNTDCEFEIEERSFAFEVEKEHPVVKAFQKVCEELEYDSDLISTFGCSDNNNFLKHGITGIVLACGMNQVHSCEEYTTVEELTRCSNIVMKLMVNEV